MPNSFENFNEGLRLFGKGLEDVRTTKDARKKQEGLRQFGQTLDTNLASQGASKQLRDMIQASIATQGSGANVPEIMSFAFKQLPNYTQNALNKLDVQFNTDPRPRDEKLPEYQKQVSVILNATDLSKDVKIPTGISNAQADKEKQDSALSDFRIKLAEREKAKQKTYEANLDTYNKKFGERKLNEEELKKAAIPDVFDEKLFPEGMTDAQVMKQLIDSGVPPDIQDRLMYIYTNRKVPMMKQFFNSVKAEVFNKLFPGTTPPPPNPSGVPGPEDLITSPQPGPGAAGFFENQ